MQKKNRKTYNAITVAQYIIQKCDEDGFPIQGCFHLLAIMYNIQKRFLAERRKPLFEDDFEAWSSGPVIPSIYRKWCSSPAIPLTLYDHKDFQEIKNKDKGLINTLLEELEKIESYKLVFDIRSEHSPWRMIFKDGKGIYDSIPKEIIRNQPKEIHT